MNDDIPPTPRDPSVLPAAVWIQPDPDGCLWLHRTEESARDHQERANKLREGAGRPRFRKAAKYVLAQGDGDDA